MHPAKAQQLVSLVLGLPSDRSASFRNWHLSKQKRSFAVALPKVQQAEIFLPHST